MPTLGNLYMWEFSQGGRELKVKVEGQLTFSSLRARVDAATEGLGLAIVPENCVTEAVAAGELELVLENWCEPFPGYFLYYPSRKQHTTAFIKFVEAVRYKG